jgi:glycosyltransferase involved in cell wall biosynthesis
MQQLDSSELPLVSVCTPTFNRRPFIKTMFECFKNQDYPMDRIEWIIVDDGTDKIVDLITSSNIRQIRYFEVDTKMTLGSKRNYMHTHVRGSIIVYMDDDDYYPPERISHAVDTLLKNPEAMCAGSSEIYLYFKGMTKMIQAGPYGENHATAGTFAFRTTLLNETKYNDDAALAEEREFLKGYTVPFVQLNPLKSILVFSHNHNTYDKRKMFKTANPQFFKESDKTVEMFIRKPTEQNIFKFFMEDIDELLEQYEPGLPTMKPDVLDQIKKIESERDEMIQKHNEAQQQLNKPIMFTQPGKEPVQLSSQEVVDMISNLQNVNQLLTKQVQEINKPIMVTQPGKEPVQFSNQEVVNLISNLQNVNQLLTKRVQELTNKINELTSTSIPGTTEE